MFVVWCKTKIYKCINERTCDKMWPKYVNYDFSLLSFTIMDKSIGQNVDGKWLSTESYPFNWHHFHTPQLTIHTYIHTWPACTYFACVRHQNIELFSLNAFFSSRSVLWMWIAFRLRNLVLLRGGRCFFSLCVHMHRHTQFTRILSFSIVLSYLCDE